MPKKLTAKAQLFFIILNTILIIISICAWNTNTHAYRELINQIKSAPSPLIKCQSVEVNCHCPDYNYMPYTPYWDDGWNNWKFNLTVWNSTFINYSIYYADWNTYSIPITYYKNKSD